VSEAWVESVASADVRDDLLILTGKDRRGELDAGGRAKLDQITRSLLSQITAIYSDEQGLKQCDRGLKISLSQAERRLTSCTAKASRVIAHETEMAKLNKQELPALAAIASEECATMYKNIRLVSGINDDKTNTTRYVAVSRDEAKAAQIVADIDVKALKYALEELSAEDVKNLFEVAPLNEQFNALSDAFGFGESSFRAGQVSTAQARLLREFLAEDKDALQALLDHLDHPTQSRIRFKLKPLAKQVHDHRKLKDEPDKKYEERLKKALKTKDYNDKVRSLFIIRAKSPDVKQADILKALVEKAGKLKNPIEFNVITELPRPIDGGDEGLGLVIEADGSLLGVKIKAKKDSAGWWADEYVPGDLERVLLDLDALHTVDGRNKKGIKPLKMSIRVLGTFAKDPRRFGANAKPTASAEARPGKGKTKSGDDWGNSREQRDGTAIGSGPGGAIAFLLTMAIAGGLAWYAWTQHLIG